MKNSCGCSGAGCVEPELPVIDRARVGPSLSTKLTWRDVVGGWAARWGIRRMNYSIAPDLHRIGKPTRESEVLVTANYKLTVDVVRRELKGLDAWLLVLDTRGVNVWCAAGKGTFGTAELVRRLCGRCHEVCPHAVFSIVGRKAEVVARGSCMQCGACRMNCGEGAIEVSSGVGCAQAVVNSLRRGKKDDTACCCE